MAIPNQMAIPDRELIKAFSNRKAAIFVGAGLSVGAGLPNWSSLMEPLKKEIEDCPDDLSPLDIAQCFCNQYKIRFLAQRLAEQLDKPEIEPTEVHRLLVRLPVNQIYTTNFDNLLEAACEGTDSDRRVNFRRVSRPGNLALEYSERLNIIKLHGDLQDPETIVITAEDFEDYFASHTELANEVANDLRRLTVLFLGYSFNDPDVRTILRRIRADQGSMPRNHFIVQINPRKAIVKELERRGLMVIEIRTSGDKTQALLGWLEDLKRRLRSDMIVEPPPLGSIPNNVPPISIDLVGRDAELASVLDSLRGHRAVIITGAPGVGKTSLAIKAGQAYASGKEPNTYQYVVWMSAKDKPKQGLWLNDVLNAIGTTLGFNAIAQKTAAEIEQKKRDVELLLGAKSTLLILDNFETMNDPSLAVWLQAIPKPSTVLITTRTDPGGSLRGVRVQLRGLEGTYALELLHRYAREFNVLERDDHSIIRSLPEVTCGNPQLMKLAFGVMAGGGTDLESLVTRLQAFDKNIDAMFTALFTSSWELLSENAERIVLITALFVGPGSVQGQALEASTGLTHEEFSKGLQQALRFSLLEPGASDGTYIIHSNTRAFALEQLGSHRKFANESRERCARYYLEFVRSSIVRQKPDVRYWNTLVTGRMKLIDPEWPMIQELMSWTCDNRRELLIEFVMLLVHYMDSRFLNVDRIFYVEKAVDALNQLNRPAEEALLRIDALGWTFVEENQLSRAYEQIENGHQLAMQLNTDERVNLLALANAWKARVRIEEQNQLEADRLIGYALADLDRCSSWIRLRVNMAAGDIALKEGSYKEALNRYEAAHAASTGHGGEGDGYQINPRLGMALINLGELDEAERKFEAIQELEGIPIGNLYGDYGLALVAHRRGEIQQAQTLLKKVRQQLEQRTGSNLLSTLMNDLYQKLDDTPGEHARFETANAGVDAELSQPPRKKPSGSGDVEQPPQSRAG